MWFLGSTPRNTCSTTDDLVERSSVAAAYPCRIERAAPRTRRDSRRHVDGREGRIDAGTRSRTSAHASALAPLDQANLQCGGPSLSSDAASLGHGEQPCRTQTQESSGRWWWQRSIR